MRVWRTCKARYEASAFDGEGARRVGGRWNSPGHPVVYTSDSAALAVLEQLVHLDDSTILNSYLLIPAELDDDQVETLGGEDLPSNWRGSPHGASTQRLGDAWLRARRSLALSVPSSVVPGRNVLLNPLHPGFAEVQIEPTLDWRIDPRLTG